MEVRGEPLENDVGGFNREQRMEVRGEPLEMKGGSIESNVWRLGANRTIRNDGGGDSIESNVWRLGANH